LATQDGTHSLSDLLDNLERVCIAAYKAEKAKGGVPLPSTLKNYLKTFLNQNLEKPENTNDLFVLIDRFIAGEIREEGKEKSKSTLENYSATRKHLRGFEDKFKVKLTYDSIDLPFFRKYVSYLKSLNLAHNTLATFYEQRRKEHFTDNPATSAQLNDNKQLNCVQQQIRSILNTTGKAAVVGSYNVIL
jgi:hypothetical protein